VVRTAGKVSGGRRMERRGDGEESEEVDFAPVARIAAGTHGSLSSVTTANKPELD